MVLCDFLCNCFNRNIYRTENRRTSVSHRFFRGFGNRKVYKSFVRCKTIKYFLTEVFKSDSGIKSSGLTDRTLILKMTENFDDEELKNKVIMEIGEIKSSTVLTIDTSRNNFCDKVHEVSSSALTFEKDNQEIFVIDSKHLLKREASNSSGDDLTCDTQSDSHTLNTTTSKMSGESDWAQVKRGPSPLLFTPVKGENTHGAGYLTQNTNSPLSHSSGNRTENCLPVLTTPPPNAAGKFVLPTTPNVNLSVEKYVIGSQRCECHFSPNKGCIPEGAVHKEIKIRHNDSPSYNLEKGTISPPKTFTSKEGANTMLTLSPNTEKLPDSSPPSPDSLLLRKCLLERHLKLPSTKTIIESEESTIKPVSLPCDSSHNDTPKKEERMETSDEPHSLKPLCAPLHQRKRRKHRLRTLLSRARHSLNGIPPPPSVTIPQMTVTEMLEKLRGFEFISTGPSSMPEVFKSSSNVVNEDSVSLFHPTATEEEIIEITWPAVLDCVHLGVCYNLGCSSEALEDICQQVREKYVGNETASSCTVWSLPRSSEESNSKQRRHDTLQASSTAREGYITRRRRAFSLASLTTTIPSIASKGRQILVNGMLRIPKDAKKTQSKHKREYEGSRVAKKEDSKRSLSKICFGDKGKNLKKLNSIKRSLSFDAGPDNQVHSSTVSASESFSSSHQAVSSLLMSTKRVLKFDEVGKDSPDVCSTQKRITASNSFSTLPDNSDRGLAIDSQDHRSSQSFSASGTVKELCELHKKKLLWAVAEALRSRGLGTGHEKFKICAIPLFRHCRDEFLNATSNGKEAFVKSGIDDSTCESKSVSVAERHKESTSDKMLQIALGLVDKIMNEIGVAPVFKEKATLT